MAIQLKRAILVEQVYTDQVETTESPDSATHTKGASQGKIKPVVIETSGEEDTAVLVLCASRTHEML
jgi:hypothetical protein